MITSIDNINQLNVYMEKAIEICKDAGIFDYLPKLSMSVVANNLKNTFHVKNKVNSIDTKPYPLEEKFFIVGCIIFLTHGYLMEQNLLQKAEAMRSASHTYKMYDAIIAFLSENGLSEAEYIEKQLRKVFAPKKKPFDIVQSPFF